MAKLRILMADDQLHVIEHARDILQDLSHSVSVATTFRDACSLAGNEMFDIAVIDLGWFQDPELKGDGEAATKGWQIDEIFKEKNPDAVRVLYSARADDINVTQAASREGLYCIQKDYSPNGPRHLADVVKVIAYRLEEETRLRAEFAKRKSLPDAYRTLEDPISRFHQDHGHERNVFVMTRFEEDNETLMEIDQAIRVSLARHGLRAHRADDRCYPDDRSLWDNVCTYMIGCDFGVAVLENTIVDEFNPNVALEYGFMRALGKPVLLLNEKEFEPRADILGTLWKAFDIADASRTISSAIDSWVNDLNLPDPADR